MIVDPTKRLSHYYGAKYFALHLISQHHMTYIRKDVARKLRNSSNVTIREAELALIKENMRSLNTASVPDEFKISTII